MKYVIGIVSSMVALVLSILFGLALVQAIAGGWEWILVALGILPAAAIAVLITFTAFKSAKEY